MQHRYKLHEVEYESQKFYSVKEMPEEALVERLPKNDLVELFENRISLLFEVDQETSLLKRAHVPINWINFIFNILFVAALLIAFGIWFVQ